MERVNVRRLPDDWGAEEEALLHAIDDATATPIYIAYHLVPEWFDGLHAAIDELEVFATRRADVGLALIEHLILRLDRASIDDSDGGLAEAFGRIEPLHARTASAHGEDPNALADRLVQFAHTLDVEPFGNAVTTHGDVLGRTGLSAIIISTADARRAGGSGDAVLDRLIADARAALREGA